MMNDKTIPSEAQLSLGIVAFTILYARNHSATATSMPFLLRM